MTAVEDASLSTLNRLFIEALMRLARSGDADAACRLAAEGHALLRRDHEQAASRLNAAMHRLVHLLPHGSATPEDTIMTEIATLDVRTLPPARRHSLIFDTYAALPPDGAFILVNDHDPKPLYYQFQAERPGEVSWQYLDQGPQIWRVRIGRQTRAA